jgi:hypothetical protein
MNIVRWIWQCKTCDDIVLSYSHQIHTMNTCDCGKSSVDLEDGYCRVQGDLEALSIKELKEGKWTKVEEN